MEDPAFSDNRAIIDACRAKLTEALRAIEGAALGRPDDTTLAAGLERLRFVEANAGRMADAVGDSDVRTRHLARIARAVAAEMPLDELLLLVYHAVKDVGKLDRVGIILFDATSYRIRGVWGTDRDGTISRAADQMWHCPPSETHGVADVLHGRAPYCLVEDFTAEYGIQPGEPMYGVRHNAGVPLIAGGEVLGLIQFDNLISGREITVREVEGLADFAAEAATAVRQARLLDERSKLLERQQRLARVSAAINRQHDLDDVLLLVRDALVEAGGFDRAGVWLYRSDSGELVGSWGTNREGGIEDNRGRNVLIPDDPRSPMYQVVREGRPYALLQEFTDDQGLTPEHRMYGVNANAVVPLKVGDAIVGVISVDNLLSDAPIALNDVETLLPFAEQAAVAIENARLLAAVRSHSTDLERLVEERTAELRTAGEELANFAYTISHDLRAPLRAIDGYAYMAIEETRELPSQVHRGLGSIRDNAKLMGRLIDDLLEYTRMGRRQIERTRVQPADCARDAARRLSRQLDGRSVDLDISDMPVCCADAELLRVLYVRLLGNALTWTAGRDLARIEVGATPDGVYYVRDNGVGFDQQYADTLFGMFTRLGRQESTAGTGVGLAFVRRIVELHGGRVWATGSPGEGAEFHFTIPAP